MHYVIGDIHNNNIKFAEMLEKIDFSQEDHLYLHDSRSWHREPDGTAVRIKDWLLENGYESDLKTISAIKDYLVAHENSTIKDAATSSWNVNRR